MLGLVVLAFIAFYLLVSILVVRATLRFARRSGRNTKLWGGMAALVMYNLLFWEVVPTILANEYYCRTAAGFHVYKTVEQWKRENPGVAETLSWQDLASSYTLEDGTRRYVLNERFISDHTKTRPILFLSTTINAEVIVDREKGDVLARNVGIGYGHGHPMLGGGWRVVDWFELKRCDPMRGELVDFRTAVKKLGARREKGRK